MSSVGPHVHGPDGMQPRPGPFRSSPTPARPPARGGRGAASRFRIVLYRHRWLRWAAAGGAALAVLAALSDDPSGPSQEPAVVAPPGPSAGLAPGTRGVPVPVDSAVFSVGDIVDVHAILDGTAIVAGAAVVSASEDEVILAVPAEHVDAVVDALTTGGVIPVLVPSPG